MLQKFKKSSIFGLRNRHSYLTPLIRSCGDLTGDDWVAPDNVSYLVSLLLPEASNYYWLPCPE